MTPVSHTGYPRFKSVSAHHLFSCSASTCFDLVHKRNGVSVRLALFYNCGHDPPLKELAAVMLKTSLSLRSV